MKLIDLTGMRFNKLTVISKAEYNLSGKPAWVCLCDCGNEITVRGLSLRSKRKGSCGCVSAAKHGMAGTPTYTSLQRAKTRCSNKNHEYYKYYGGTGITVCDRWSGENGFEAFLLDMGLKPSSKHSLDRIDNNKGYSPENCRWATIAEQANNKKNNHILSYNGESMSIAQWSRKLGINAGTLYSRIQRGWSVERSLAP